MLSFLRLTSVLIATAALAFALLAGLLYSSKLIDLGLAFSMLSVYAPQTALAAALIGLILLAIGFWQGKWLSVVVALGVICTSLSIILSLLYLQQLIKTHPLHDVTTNLDNPPQFSKLIARQYKSNSAAAKAAYPHANWKEQHLKLYPDIKPLSVSLSYEQTIKLVEESARSMGWQIEGIEQQGTITKLEATEVSRWFRFVDNIVIQISQNEAGTYTIDARSVSRIGLSDLGANAARLREFLKRSKRAL